MAGKAPKGSEELLQAYNLSMASGFAAMNAGMAQATAAVKLMTEAGQAERAEISKVWGQEVDRVSMRNENLAELIPGIMKEMSAAPVNGKPAISPEVKDAVGKVIEGEMASYRAWTKAWSQYLVGVEQRRSAMTQSLVESGAGAVESGQEAVRGAVKFGETIVDWSTENFNVKNK